MNMQITTNFTAIYAALPTMGLRCGVINCIQLPYMYHFYHLYELPTPQLRLEITQ
jgi:hypothetical protein